jgi:hypothetical protein
MPSTLIFPDGVRLARRDEIPGPEPQQSDAWARVERAGIARGFVLKSAIDEPFTHYAEINVDAPRLWELFCDLCQVLLGERATFVAGEIDAELVSVGPADVRTVIKLLARYQYQLAHDGFLQYGLVSDQSGAISEIFVTPAKYLKVWMSDEPAFQVAMARHEIKEVDHLEFLDEFPRTTVTLSPNSVALPSPDALIKQLQNEISVTGPHAD